MSAKTADVVVIGAGVMGCAIARVLARGGARVRLLERSVPGAEASTVAAGILAPLAEHTEAGPLRKLGVESRDLYPLLAEALRADTGIAIGYVRSGVLVVARSEEAARSLLAPEGAVAERMDGDTARRREPALAHDVLAAIDLPDEGQVEPEKMLRAMLVDAVAHGAVLTSGAVVRGLGLERERVTSVITDHETIACDHVVVAAGSWTSLVPGLSIAHAQAVRPVRGQLVHLAMHVPPVKRIVFGDGAYVVPRPDGRVVCGATMEEAGFVKEVTLGGVVDVSARALALVPSLGAARFEGTRVSFRPASSDGLPLIGPAGPEGLWLATGHFRNGILLAPATAELIGSMIRGAPSAHDSAPFDPRRVIRA